MMARPKMQKMPECPVEALKTRDGASALMAAAQTNGISMADIIALIMKYGPSVLPIIKEILDLLSKKPTA